MQGGAKGFDRSHTARQWQLGTEPALQSFSLPTCARCSSTCPLKQTALQRGNHPSPGFGIPQHQHPEGRDASGWPMLLVFAVAFRHVISLMQQTDREENGWEKEGSWATLSDRLLKMCEVFWIAQLTPDPRSL